MKRAHPEREIRTRFRWPACSTTGCRWCGCGGSGTARSAGCRRRLPGARTSRPDRARWAVTCSVPPGQQPVIVRQAARIVPVDPNDPGAGRPARPPGRLRPTGSAALRRPGWSCALRRTGNAGGGGHVTHHGPRVQPDFGSVRCPWHTGQSATGSGSRPSPTRPGGGASTATRRPPTKGPRRHEAQHPPGVRRPPRSPAPAATRSPPAAPPRAATIHVETCSACHPFYTGKQRVLDTAGRVAKFQQKYAKVQAKKAK